MKIFKNIKPKFGDEEVERIRRAHLNDLENIPIFIIAGLFYILTGPSTIIAITLIRIGAIGRIAHTISYCFLKAQPARAISFLACVGATAYMAIQSALYFL